MKEKAGRARSRERKKARAVGANRVLADSEKYVDPKTGRPLSPSQIKQVKELEQKYKKQVDKQISAAKNRKQKLIQMYKELGPRKLDAHIKKRTREIVSRISGKSGASSGAGSFFSSSESGKKKVNANSKSVLSLIVEADSSENARAAIRELLQVSREKGVRIGQVLVLGLNNWNLNRTKKPGKFSGNTSRFRFSTIEKFLRLSSFVQRTSIDARKVVKRLKVSGSPTWVVRHEGRDHVFDSSILVEDLFDDNGEFIEPSSESDEKESAAVLAKRKRYANKKTVSLRYDKAPVVVHGGEGGTLFGGELNAAPSSDVIFEHVDIEANSAL